MSWQSSDDEQQTLGARLKRSIRALEEEEVPITSIFSRTGFKEESLYRTALAEFTGARTDAAV